MQRDPQFGPVSFGLKLAEGKSSVDRDAGVIKGLSVITEGPALTHGFEIDEVFASQLVKAGESFGRKGVKSRFGHPSFLSGSEGRFLGSVVNFRKDGQQVRADLMLSKAAESSPLGNLKAHLLDLAEHDPEKFGMSIVFDDDEPEFRRNKDGKRTRGRDGEPLPPLVRLARLDAVDFVDSPAANAGGMFSVDPATGNGGGRMTKTETVDLSSVTAAEFKSAQPDAVNDWINEGNKDGVAIGRDEGRDEIVARAKQFTAAFPGDPEFALKQLASANGLETAKLEHRELLLTREKAQATQYATELEAKEKEIKQLQIDAGTPSAYVSDVAGGKAGEKAGAEKLAQLQAEYDAQHESFRDNCTFESFCAAGDEIDKGGEK